MQRISICLSDLPKEKIKQALNGKLYINLIVTERRETDPYGNTLTVYADLTKEERESRVERTYVGGGKTISFEPTTSEVVDQLPPVNNPDDLPWINLDKGKDN